MHEPEGDVEELLEGKTRIHPLVLTAFLLLRERSRSPRELAFIIDEGTDSYVSKELLRGWLPRYTGSFPARNGGEHYINWPFIPNVQVEENPLGYYVVGKGNMPLSHKEGLWWIKPAFQEQAQELQRLLTLYGK